MIRLRFGIAAGSTLLAFVFSSVSLAQDRLPVKALDPDGIERLESETAGAARVSIHRATGAARFVRIAPESKRSLAPLAAAAGPEQKSAAFFSKYGSIFGISQPEAELELSKTEIDAYGAAHLVYRQLYRGVPVFAGELKSHFDSAGRLTAVNGTFVPQIELDPVPNTTEIAARKAAIARVESQLESSVESQLESSVELTARNSTLYIYRTGLAQGVPGRNHLAWEVEVVGDGGSIREFVYIDAHTGKLIDQITGIHDAMFRRAYDGKNLSTVPPSYPDKPWWEEGDRFPTRNAEANNMLLASQETYNFFDDAFSRDSFDDKGAIMDQIFDRGYGCPNASWNGTFISFCPGLTTDDVTAHEWGHAYTQYTHNLIYQWQPGALNEAYSDMWGETVDQINGRGLDSPGGPRANGCSAFTTIPPTVTINSPPAIAGVKRAGTAAFGPQTFTVTKDVILANDGVGTTNDGCCAGPTFVCAANSWPNAAAIAGKFAFVDRGTCGFAIKVKNAQVNGAVGVIVGNNQGGNVIVNMAGTDATITIPSLSVTQDDGTAIKGQLATTTVNATLSRGAKGTENSYRWLLAEEATGFGEAIRDMWNPGCYSDPGKVSDVNYFCGTGDGGGVHTNSGVPNHGYALIADGGTFNGRTIGALGLTKTAHIFFRAMTTYQVQTSDFADHADAIEQSCADLIGVPLTPIPGQPSGQSVTASDCAQVENATAAIELRTSPTQCNFKPLLAKNPPAQCEERRFYTADFESGTAGYTATRTEVVPADFTDRDWERVSSLPDGRAGFAFFAVDPDIGTCAPGGDESGVLHLASPVIALPAGMGTPVLTFDHYITSEFGFDGGNLRISVDGGAFTLVPAADYTFNAYNTTLVTAAAGNTDPLAGQVAFSGSDGGVVFGSWGQSQVKLSSSLAGHTVQLRWDFGTDGCTGALYGWFVDDVRLYNRDFSTQPIVIAGCNTGVPNSGTPTGCTITESLSECAENATTHDQYTDCVAQTTSPLVSAGIITNKQKADIQRCAAAAPIP